MPLPERTYRHVDTSRSPTATASVEQFLRGTGGDSSRMSPTHSPTSPSSPYFERMKHDPEEDHALSQRKSVLSKVKEKAKKFRNSLSKRRTEEENVTPSWGVSLEDDEEEDAEYLGAPMYESELAPESYKENARQHPRANPVISEKHVLSNTVKLGVEQDREKSRDSVKSMTTTQPATTNMTSESISQKLTPVYTGGSNADNYVSSKVQAAVSATSPAANMSSQTSPVPSSLMQNSSSLSASLGEKNTYQKSASVKDYPMNKSAQGDDARAGSSMQKSASMCASMSGKNTSPKSASVKDYMMNKSDPRGDAKTVSQLQVISEATSPRRTSSNAGVIDKVKGAVNSLLGNEEPSQQYGAKNPTTRTSAQTQVGQEENRGRVLQAN